VPGRPSLRARIRRPGEVDGRAAQNDGRQRPCTRAPNRRSASDGRQQARSGSVDMRCQGSRVTGAIGAVLHALSGISTHVLRACSVCPRNGTSAAAARSAMPMRAVALNGRRVDLPGGRRYRCFATQNAARLVEQRRRRDGCSRRFGREARRSGRTAALCVCAALD
jgi:hypothetical protein